MEAETRIDYIGYIRVSTNKGEDSTSLEEQGRLIERWCMERGYHLLAIYREVASASTVSGRPVLQAALEHLFTSDVGGIVVSNYDRLSRDVADSADWLKRFVQARKDMASVQEEGMNPSTVDPDDPFGDMPWKFRMMVAESERKLIKRRLANGRKAAADRGGWIGGQIPWGFKLHRDPATRIKTLVPCPDEQRAIGMILELAYIKLPNGQWKYNIRGIANILSTANRTAQEQGLQLPYPNARGGSNISPSSVWTIIKEGRERIA